MEFAAMDVIVEDVPRAVAFFRDVLGVEVAEEFDRFARLDLGAVQLMLSPDAMVPVERAEGLILHFRVEDVAATVRRVETRGAEVVLEPTRTDWGTEMAMVRGPEGLLVELYRSVG